MNKFLTLFLFALFAGQACSANFLSRRENGDLSPKHRRLSEAGQLKLKIEGRGYFMYRLRVKPTSESDMVTDGSQAQPTSQIYDSGYAVDGGYGKPDVNTQAVQAPTISATSVTANQPDANINAGSSDTVESEADGDDDNFSQVVYSRDGSLHVNKYGYLCDDNGLLLVSTGKSLDVNAKFHIHIPSRAESILVTPSGKVLAEELGGSVFTDVGQLKLARFENPQGLNVRLHMKSNCAAANEDGFALGNWCAGTELDGKDHVYMSETQVSGPGIVGKPGDQGLGRIVQ